MNPAAAAVAALFQLHCQGAGAIIWNLYVPQQSSFTVFES
jgi:hypothetical protein